MPDCGLRYRRQCSNFASACGELRKRVDIGVPSDPATGVLDRVEHCSLLHVVRIEELPPVPPPPANGPPA